MSEVKEGPTKPRGIARHELTPAEIERFKSHIDMSGECWLWTGSINRDGYGIWSVIRPDRKLSLKAHRVAVFVFTGKDPGSLCQLHKCDVRRCVRPDHMFQGTHRDNVADRHAKGRDARHERMGTAKLTVEKAAEIRSLYSAGSASQRQLARRFGVSRRAVTFVLDGTTWR